jgi:hypothetical protein
MATTGAAVVCRAKVHSTGNSWEIDCHVVEECSHELTKNYFLAVVKVGVSRTRHLAYVTAQFDWLEQRHQEIP